MKICVLLIADSVFMATNYFFKQLTLNVLPFFNPIKSRKSTISTHQGLQLAACSLKPIFPGHQ